MRTKKTLLLIIICTIISTQYSYGQVELPVTTGFETGSTPAGWITSIINGNFDWDYADGGGYDYDVDDIRYPESAYTGNFNARFFSSSSDQGAMLITPVINLRYAIKPVLSFYMAMPERYGVDELRILVRVSEASEWIEIDKYTVPVELWKRREVVIPDSIWKNSSGYGIQTFQLAFHAKTNAGYGVSIDNVALEDKGIVKRKVNSVDLIQLQTAIPSGTKGNPIAIIKIEVTGNTDDIKLNTAKLTYTGTDINDIESIGLFYCRDSVFTPENPINGTLTVSGNNFNITGMSNSLHTGNNHIYICASIKTTAKHDNRIDIELPANGLTISTNTYPAVKKAPAGYCTIEESLIAFGFEESNAPTQWNTTGIWQIGAPLGTGINDPTFAFSGTNILATNLGGNYLPNMKDIAAVSPIANAKFYKSLKVRYAQWLNLEGTDNFSIKLSNDNSTTWKTLEIFQYNSDKMWKPKTYSISNHATRKEHVNIKFSIDSTDASTEYGGWNIDNFAITGDYIAQDVGVKSRTAPEPYCGLTNSETIKIIVRNSGGETVTDNFQVGYSLNNGASYVKEMFTTDIASEHEAEFAFATKADLSTPGMKYLKFKTFLATDEDATNDEYSEQFYVFPTVKFPIRESFEKSNAYWYASGTNSSWAWGTPAKTRIDTASDGSKVWTTKLTGNHNANEHSYLESSCFDLSTATYPVLSFDYRMHVEEGVGGLCVEYSINGGRTWNVLPPHTAHNSNWHNNSTTVTALGTPGWSTNNTSYTTAYTLLPDNTFNVNGVKIRFVFAGGADANHEGVAIDNIKVTPLPYDVSIIADNFAPIDACEIGDTSLTFSFKNLGHRTIKANTKLPFNIKIDNQKVVADTILLSADLIKNSTVILQTTKRYSIATPGEHKIAIATTLEPTFGRSSDDTLRTTVKVLGMPFFTLGADIGTSQSDTVSIKAGEGYSTYAWVKKTYTVGEAGVTPADTSTWGAWEGYSPTPNHTAKPETNEFGYFSVTVTNSNSCSATDTVRVINSNQDVLISEIDNSILANSCYHNDPIFPKVTIKHNDGDEFDGTISFNIGLSVNGVEKLSEPYTPSNGFSIGNTHVFTFTNSINLSEYGSYTIKAYTKYPNDVNRTNDTLAVNIDTYGIPELEFAYPDTINTTQPNLLSFTVDNTFSQYQWESKPDRGTWTNLGISTNTLNLISIGNHMASAYYRISVMDANGCNFTRDSVYVNTKDIGVYDISSPNDTICFSTDGANITATIVNYGHDIYPVGTNITASIITPMGSQIQTIITTSIFNPNDTIAVTFPEKTLFGIGDNAITILAEVNNDVNALNDSKSANIHVVTFPTVSIEPDTLMMAFNASSMYEISPIYSDDCVNYLWNDGATSEEYTIIGIPQYSKYSVIASNRWGCSATDSIAVLTTDIAITRIVSPIDTCSYEASKYRIKLKVENQGTEISAGAKIAIEAVATIYKFGTSTNVVLNDTIHLNKTWASQADTIFTMASPIVLRYSNGVSIDATATPIGFREVTATNNSITKTSYALGYPTPNLGPDRTIIAWKDTLTLTKRYNTYLWQDGSTDSLFVANTTGNYNVKVTDFSGCSGTDQINLTFLVKDIGVETLISPVTSCVLGNEEPVTFRIKNNGTLTIPASTTAILGFKQNDSTYTENYTFASDFAPESTATITLTGKMDFSTKKTYPVKVWAHIAGDMRTNNDTITKNITAHTPISISLADQSGCMGDAVTLNAGSYSNNPTYLWNTGATTRTITTTVAGVYSVQVTNEYGCESTGSLTLTLHPLPTINLVPDTAICTGGSLTLDAGNTGTTYSWSTGDEDQSITVSSPGTYIVTVTDLNGCSQKDTTTLSLLPLPVFTLGPDISICAGGTVILNAGPASSYLWSTNSTQQSITATTSGNYWAQITDANGCSATDHITVTVNDIPSVSIGADQTICKGDTATLTATTNTGAHFLWSTGQTTKTIKVTNNTSYWVKVTNAHGCVNYDTVAVNYHTPVIVNIGNDTTVCANTPLTLHANTGLYTYLWSTNSTSNSIVVHSAGKYYVTIEDLNHCSYSDTITVLHHAIPTVNLGADIKLCPAQTAQINANIANVQYLWNTGQNTQSITTTTAGNYWVIATDANNCSNSDTINISYYPQFTVNLGNDVSYCYDTTHVLNAGNAGYTYLWSTGQTTQTITVSETNRYYVVVTDTHGCSQTDTINLYFSALPPVNLGPDIYSCQGGTVTLDAGNYGIMFNWSTGQTTQTITVTQENQYSVTITDSNNCSNSDTINVYFNTPIHVSLGQDVTICQGSPITLDAGGPGLTYLWNTGETTQTITTTVPGQYSVIVHNAQGCTDSDTINISTRPLPPINLGNDIALCDNTPYTLNAPNGYVNYLWSNNATTQSITTTLAGEYWVQITDSHGCSNRDTIARTSLPKPYVNLGADFAICSGSTITLNPNSTTGNHLWSNGSTAQTITVTPAQTAQYWVSVTSSNGCSSNDTVTVTVNTLPVITHSPISTCSNINTLVLEGGQPANGTYSGIGVTNNVFAPAIAGAGTHTIYYNVTDQNGCSNSINLNITVNVAPTISLGPDAQVATDTTLNAGAGYASYLWGNGTTSQTFTATQTGTYNVTVTDNNGCQAADTITITFNDPITLLVSQLLSPTIECSTSGDYPIELTILNRGGRTYSTNEKITVHFSANNGAYSTEDVTLTGTLAPNGSFTKQLTSKIPLNVGNNTIALFASFNGTNCATRNFNATVHQSPTLQFDTDTLKVQLPYTFNPNIGGNYTYTWSTGSTSSTLIITAYGTYWLTITDPNGCSASDTINVIATSIGSIPNISAQVIAFPNPTSRELNIGIKSNEHNQFTIRIISPIGMLVWQKDIPPTNSHLEKIDVSGYTPGVYMVNVGTRGHSTTLKVIISR